MKKTSNLTAQQTISAGLDLLTLLSRAPQSILPIDCACQTIGISEQQLIDVVDVLASLGDSETGARAVIFISGDSIVLQGDAASLRPIRLDGMEGTVLAHVLKSLSIDEGLQQRTAESLLPLGSRQLELESIADTTPYGSFFQPLLESIEDGVRCRMLYRSSMESTPSWRLIDPIAISHDKGKGYLKAWNVEHDEQRLYRLDRIQDIEATDESVVQHDTYDDHHFSHMSTADSWAQVSFPSAALVRDLDWPGVDLNALAVDEQSGRVIASVPIASETWLFDQLISMGGGVRIVEPVDMKRRLCAYAESLLQKTL